MRILALNENYQCWDRDRGLARIGSKGILPRIGCRSRSGVFLARRHRSCGLLRRPEQHRHRRVSYRERIACGPPYSQVYAEGTGRSCRRLVLNVPSTTKASLFMRTGRPSSVAAFSMQIIVRRCRLRRVSFRSCPQSGSAGW